MFELIGCPMYLGVPNTGLEDAVSALNSRWPELAVKELPVTEMEEENLENLKNRNSVAATCAGIAAEEARVIAAGNVPLFIGGDHSAAIGTVSGAAEHAGRLGLLWIDAHSDINTDVTTLTGNIHGMPVSALMGYGDEKLRAVHGEAPKLLPEDVVLFGVRDMDPLEEDIVERLNIRCYTFKEIEARGLSECLLEALASLTGISSLHVSFDLDSMDPELIRGVTVPVEGGFTPEQVFSMFACLQGHGRISSIDIVEYNPARDTDGKTGEFVRELIRKITNA